MGERCHGYSGAVRMARRKIHEQAGPPAKTVERLQKKLTQDNDR